MPRLISKNSGSRIPRPNGLALVKKTSSPSSVGRSSILSRRVSSRNNGVCVCPKYLPFYWEQLGSNIDGEAAEDRLGFSVSLSSDGTILASGAILNDGNGINSGHVRVFKWNGATWEQLGSDIDGESAQDYSGYSVSLSSDGTILAAGAIYNDGNGIDSGHVRVFKWNGTAWEQLGSDIDGESPQDRFGISVSLSSDGTILAAGAIYNDGIANNSGHVRVFRLNGTAWEQLGGTINGEGNGDEFGTSVSLSSDGTILAAGSSKFNEQDGYIKVFRWNETAWEQIGNTIGNEIVSSIGISVSLSSDGTILAAGASFDDRNGENSGRVQVFKWNGTAWKQLGSDIDGEAAEDRLGASVSLSSDGTILAVGARRNDGNGENSGRVQVFKWNGTAWKQLGDNIDGESAGDSSGKSVSLSSDGTILASGAIFGDSINGENSGYVRVFKWKQ